MMTRLRVLCLLPVLAIAPGCIVAAVAAGAAVAFGAVKYADNEAYQDFRADLDTTWDACVAAVMESRQLERIDRIVIEGTRRILSHGDLQVTAATRRGGVTRVTVRVGTFETDEHKRQAGLLLEAVDARLADGG